MTMIILPSMPMAARNWPSSSTARRISDLILQSSLQTEPRSSDPYVAIPEIPGTYYILLRQTSSSATGDYVFKLRETTLEDPFLDHDYFAFDANGGEKLAFIIDRPSNYGLEFAIIAPDGTTKLKSLCCNLGGFHQSTFTLPNVPGTYYILLRQSSSSAGGDYLFKLRETDLEHPFRDHDYFAFDAGGGERLVFIIDRPTNFGLEFALFAPDGTTQLKSVCCNLGNLYQLEFTLPNEAGTYYILMRQSSSLHGGDYVLELRATAPAGPFPFIIGGEAVSIIPSTPPSIDLAPDISFNPVDTSHTLTATVTGVDGLATEGATVFFNVIAGPNNGNSGTDTTDANGNATFAYTGDGGVGLDQIQAGFFDTDGTEIESDVVLKSWNDCSSSPLTEISPADGATVSAGIQMIISGRWLDRNGSDLSTPAIVINGRPADSTDVSGRFFKSVVLEPGENTFHVEGSDACGNFHVVLTLNGSLPDPESTGSMSDVTVSLKDEYRDTTFNRANNWLVVDALARNTGFAAIDGPVLMAIGPQLDPAVDPINRHGNTVEGEPYYGMVSENVRLSPTEAGEPVNLLFHDPERVPVDYDVRWLAYGNHAPQFSSVPLTRAVPELAYVYDAVVHDPDGDPIVFALGRAPVSMAIDDQTGQVTWLPEPADLGLHEVTILAQDNSGGSALQSFTISVGAAQQNRSPLFTSAPITQADTGADYAYDANAVDFDGDAITYSLLDGPAGMVIYPASGLVEWNQALAGQHPVVLQAADAMGGLALQTFVLYVGELSTNQSIPQISGLPDPFAVVDAHYLYQPVAIDADGDPLTFSLLANPDGMTIDTITGLIQWQPDATQLGGPHPVSISVSDGKGGVAGQSFSITVVAVALHPPVFQDPPPPLFALVGQTYAYQALAIDPDAGAVSYTLTLAPAGMVIDADSGLLSWLPEAGDVGLHQVVIEAIDSTGDKAHLGYRLTVRAGNSAPQIVSSPGHTVVAGNIYRYLVLANDSDGDALTYALDQGPTGMAIDPVTGLMIWTTSKTAIGTHPVALSVRDCCGGLDQQTFDLTVEADVIPPGGVISFSQEPAPLGEIIQVLVSVSDNVGIQSVGLTAACNGEPSETLILDDNRMADFTASALGFCTFQATVTDLSQNETIVNRELEVGSQGHAQDPFPPTCDILSPAVESVITSPIQMTASVSDLTASGDPGSGPFNWTVRIARFGTSDFRTIGSGTGSEITAQLDPTSLPNDTYKVECAVHDGVQTKTIDFRYHLAGDLKLGNFSVTFVDLTIPVTGIPMVIAREYNSLDTTLHEFGAGWRLRLAGQVTDSAREDPLEGFSTVTRVFVTRPDGRRVSFDFAPVSLGFPWPSVFLPRFTAEPGEYGTLTVADDALFQQENGQFYHITGPFNPSSYVYTTREGVAYTLDEVDGLQSVEDLNGNTLQVTEQGLISSTGLSLLFERNESGQITRVIEPEIPGDPAPPAELNYEYDGLGNLIAVIDQLGGRTTLRYDDPNFRHYMTGLENPLGQTLVRNVYDNDGVLVAICDANGDIVSLDGCASFDPDAGTRSETTFNARGFREDFIYDEKGNLLIKRNFMQNGDILDTVHSYDADNNVLSKTDPEGNTASFSYDGQGNLLTVTDPSGVRTVTLTYNDLNLPETKCDELDNCTFFTYDEKRNLRFVEDPLGAITEFRYNSLGQREAKIDAEGNTWQFDYDAFGFLTAIIDPLGNSTLLLYTPSGDLEAVIDRNGREIIYEYDDAHRVISETWDTSPPTVFTYDYNAAGQMTSAVTPDSVMAFEYTNTGLLERLDNTGAPGAPAVIMTYTFDENQNVTRVSDSLGGETVYEYDELDRMVSVRQEGAGVNEKRVDWIEDDAGLIRELRRYRDLAGTLPVSHTFFDYECRGCPHRMSAIEHRNATDNSMVHNIQINRDPVGNILQLVDAEGTHDYGYDDVYRLSWADHPAGGVQADEFYTYDLVGNRLSSHRSASYDFSYQLGAGGNQLSQDDQFEYDYDNNGNLIRKTDRSTGLITGYTYDHRDRLVSVIDYALNGDPVKQVSYKYDAADRRILVNDNGSLSHYFYDATNPVLKLDDSGNVRVRRMYSRQTDDVLTDEVLGQTRWFLTDQVGNVRDLVDNDSQSINHYTYDSFGVTLDESASALENDLTFNSREFNQDTGIGFYRSRSYSPELGRFLQEDPRSPFNYFFVDNNPLIFNDPTGEVAALEYGLRLYCGAKNLAEKIEDPDPRNWGNAKAVNRIYKAGMGNIAIALSGGTPDDPATIRKQIEIGVAELWVQLWNDASANVKLQVDESGEIGLDLSGTLCSFK
jgi:RHS repeat-associated protein